MIEIERRGYLTPEFKDWLEREAKRLEKCEQLTIFCKKNAQELEVYFNDRQVSFAVMIKKVEGVMTGTWKAKVGEIGEDSREEIAVKFDPAAIKQIFRLMTVLGVKVGAARFYRRTDYEYDGITISVKEGGLLADHFEIEVEVADEKAVPAFRQKMADFLVERGLREFEREEYEQLLKKIFAENPPVPLMEINLAEYGMN